VRRIIGAGAQNYRREDVATSKGQNLMFQVGWRPICSITVQPQELPVNGWPIYLALNALDCSAAYLRDVLKRCPTNGTNIFSESLPIFSNSPYLRRSFGAERPSAPKSRRCSKPLLVKA
jgi:hypothetical protein